MFRKRNQINEQCQSGQHDNGLVLAIDVANAKGLDGIHGLVGLHWDLKLHLQRFTMGLKASIQK